MTKGKLDIFINPKFDFNTLLDRKKYNFYFEINTNMVYDAAIIINTPTKNFNIKVIQGNVFCLMMEPKYKTSTFMYKRLYQYDKAFSSLKNKDNVVLSHTYLGWTGDQYNIGYWKNLSSCDKTKIISCISSDKRTSSGNKLRYDFVEYLKKTNLPIDFFGRGTKELKDKHEGLREYKYSIAIENASYDYYFTEKIMDCFMNYTVPIYYGCTNIYSFFPKESYIWIDINNKEEAFKKIREIITEDDYKRRIPFIKIARDLVLDKYNLYSFIEEREADILKNIKEKKTYIKEYKLKRVSNYLEEIKFHLFPKVKWLRDYFQRFRT